MCFFGFGAGENERETDYGRIAEQWHSNLSTLKGEMSHSDRGVQECITILLHPLNKAPILKRIGKEQNLKNGKCYRRFSHCS